MDYMVDMTFDEARNSLGGIKYKSIRRAFPESERLEDLTFEELHEKLFNSVTQELYRSISDEYYVYEALEEGLGKVLSGKIMIPVLPGEKVGSYMRPMDFPDDNNNPIEYKGLAFIVNPLL